MRYGYKVYFSERPKNRVICWDPDTRKASVVAGEPRDGDDSQRLNDPYGLALDKSGRLLIADKRNNRLCRVEKHRLKPLKLDDTDGHRRPIPESRYQNARQRLISPAGLFAERDGSLLCAFSDDFTVYRIHPTGHLELLLGLPPNRPQMIRKIRDVVPQNELKDVPLFGPTAIAGSADGTIVFIERGYQTVRLFHPSTGMRTIFPFSQSRAFRNPGRLPQEGALTEYHPAYPSAVAFDADGGTVLQPGAGDSAGKYAGFAFGPKGAVWVLDAETGTIQEYSQTKGRDWVVVGAPVAEVGGVRFEFFAAGAGVVCG